MMKQQWISLLFFAGVALTTGTQVQKHACRKRYEKVGCFHDRVIPDHPLTIQLLNRMDKYSKKWDGQLMDWKHYHETLYKLACKCAELALQGNYTYFGIQFYGECWTGPDAEETFQRDGPSSECVGGKFEVCNDSTSAECAGKCFSNYIYKVHKPIDGGWNNWGKWSGCSGKCGKDGIQLRTRACNNPLPAHGGKLCVGEQSETRKCKSKPCAEWANWGSWAPCTTSRKRECVIPGTNTRSKSCPGKPQEIKNCIKCQGDWTGWGSWGKCISPTPCGGGFKTRTRVCLPLTSRCDGPAKEDMKCIHQCEKHWTAWGAWSSCSRTCGGGSRTRSRNCIADGTSIQVPGCPGSATQSGKCNIQGCPVWGPYGSWGPCIGKCGTGIQYRNKICVIAGTNTPTSGCVGNAPRDQTTCKLQGCPVWTSWGTWGPCSRTCSDGPTLKRTRNRRCVIEGTSTATSGCLGPPTELGACILPRCRDLECRVKCIIEDYEGYICAQKHNKQTIEFRNFCEFKKARECTMPGITVKNHGRCRIVAGGGGGGGGGLGPIGPVGPAQ